MSRTTETLDRIATVLVALMLIAVGVIGIWWWSDRSPMAPAVSTAGLTDLVGQAWWPWASAAGGVLLILLGLGWMLAHLRRRGVSTLHLRDSGTAGRLDIAASKVAGAAADALTDTLGVRSARGVVVRDRGQLVARLAAVIEPTADLPHVAERADLVSAQLAQALERDDLRCSVQLRVARSNRRLPRAR